VLEVAYIMCNCCGSELDGGGYVGYGVVCVPEGCHHKAVVNLRA
jgi:hypothetical protein